MAGLGSLISTSSVTSESLKSYATVSAFPSAASSTDELAFLSVVDGVNQPGLYKSDGATWTNTNTGKITGVVTLTVDRDVLATDVDKFIYSNEVTDIDFTIVEDTTLDVPIKSEWVFGNRNTGALTLVEGAGVTIISKGDLLGIDPEGAGASLIKIAANTYWLFGDLI